MIEGVGSVDESAITGESAPVIREAGGDRSAVTGGTRLLSDRLVVRVTQEPGGSFLDRMIALVEGAERRKTPNEIALNILIAGLTLAFLVAVVTLKPFAIYAGTDVSTTALIALLVALIPTTIGALLSAIGIAGMDRLVRRNVLAMSGRAVEASGDVDVLLLDKTGTITLGNRQAAEFIPVDGVDAARARRGGAARVARRRDARGPLDRRARQGASGSASASSPATTTTFVPFSASTRMSGIDVDGRQIRKGAADAIKAFIAENGGSAPPELDAAVQRVAAPGRHAARRRARQLGARRRPSEGHRQGRHERAIRRAAPDGHPHGDDHGRQPGHGCGDRGRGGRRRLPRRGDAGGEARADPSRSRSAAA